MECHSIFSPSTSRSANIRKRRLGPYSRVTDGEEVAGSINGVPTGMQIPVVVDANRQTSMAYHREQVPHAYVSEVARRYAEKIRKMKERTLQPDCETESTSLPMIKQRLRRLIGECDIERITCCVPMCGRVFSSVQVLAWHMSYSHHDLALKSAYDNLCFVCGVRMDTAKGKTIHLTSKHKALSVSHNEQCMYQRLPVISPLAPAAMRLLQFADEGVTDGDAYDEVAYNGYDRGGSNGQVIADDGVQLAMNT
ncbi:hypothetical protein COOONC_05213 [Cooperia oncophora]